MKPYLVFTGTASVGKTTLIKPLISLLEEKHKEPVKYITEVARSLQLRGHVINKEATSRTQRLIEDEYLRLEEEYMESVRISDRSIIDRYSYAMLNGGPAIDEQKRELLDWYDKNILNQCAKYSHIFHIPLTDDLKLELDGVRSPDEAYRREVDRLQHHIINKYNIKVHTLSGSVEERLDLIKNAVGLRKHGFIF